MEQDIEIRRTQQQGLGKPIISANFQGKKYVAINNKLAAGDWVTFHDFLIDFFESTISQSWGKDSFKGPNKELHPIIIFYKKVTKTLSKALKSSVKQFKDTTKVVSVENNGEMQCFLNFAYSLYVISHNNTLNRKFLRRLKHHDQFWGAYYEALVTCIMIRAGFEIVFEDESDNSTTHGEFIAIDKETGKKYWVEAKFKLAKSLSKQKGSDHNNYKHAITKLFKALKKKTNLERIIFIELCTPNHPQINNEPPWLQKLSDMISNSENELIDGNSAPEAFLCFTSQEMFCNLKSKKFSKALFIEGFKKKDFGNDKLKVSIDEALALREKHKFITRIYEAYKNFEVPSTFNGEIPEFAFNKKRNNARLIIGNQYLIPDDNGNEIVGTLRQAFIMLDDDNSCTCLFDTEKGSSICKIPLSEEEFRAYKLYPDTFFGRFEKAEKRANSVLDLYDFVYQSYKDTPKEKLLEFMKNSNDPSLKEKSQKELVQAYAKGMAQSMAQSSGLN